MTDRDLATHLQRPRFCPVCGLEHFERIDDLVEYTNASFSDGLGVPGLIPLRYPQFRCIACDHVTEAIPAETGP